MKLDSKVYDVLKWVVITVLPAAAVLIGTVGPTLGWQYTDTTVTILNAVTVFLGATIGVSSINYQKQDQGGIE